MHHKFLTRHDAAPIRSCPTPDCHPTTIVLGRAERRRRGAGVLWQHAPHCSIGDYSAPHGAVIKPLLRGGDES